MVDYPWPVTYWAADEQAENLRQTTHVSGLKTYHLLGIGEKESRNNPGPAGRPVIRVEPHHFERFASPAEYARARGRGLFTNPRDQERRWANYVQLRSINRGAADKSHSWGIGQVMGFNWDTLGFLSVGDLIDLAINGGPKGQFELMGRFLYVNNIVEALVNGDYDRVARVYNGRNHRQNNYVPDLIEYLERHRSLPAPPRPGDGPAPIPDPVPVPEPPAPEDRTPLRLYTDKELQIEFIERGFAATIHFPEDPE